MGRWCLLCLVAIVGAADANPALRAQAKHQARYPTEARSEFESGFPGLATTVAGTGSILYSPSQTVVINQQRRALPHHHGAFCDDGLECYDVVLIQAQLWGDTTLVVFTEGPSGDPAFYCLGSDGRRLGRLLPGEVLALPGDGSVFTFARYNNAFPKRSRWRIREDGFEEVQQPFYRVNLASRTLKEVTLRSRPDAGDVVAELARGTRLTVVLTPGVEEADGMDFLVSTGSGLLGWVRVPVLQYQATVLEGIFWWGD